VAAGVVLLRVDQGGAEEKTSAAGDGSESREVERKKRKFQNSLPSGAMAISCPF